MEIVAVEGLAATLVVLTCFAVYGFGHDGLQWTTSYTARLSFCLFMVAYCIGPLWRITRSPVWQGLLVNRRGLGLGFALAHFIHLGALSAYIWIEGVKPGKATLIAGGLAYGLLALMAVTSNDAAVRWIGPKAWRLLHRTGMHVIWLVFVLTLVGLVSKPGRQDQVVHLLMLVIAFAGAGLRSVGWFMSRTRRAITA